MWRKPFHLRWAEEDGILFLLTEQDGSPVALQPYADEAKWGEAVEKWLAFFEGAGQPFQTEGLEKDFADFLARDGRFEVTDDRDAADYVYLAEKLIKLSGRKLHSKKNHLNAFHKLYPQAEYLPLTEELVPACLQELDRWYAQRARDIEQEEQEADNHMPVDMLKWEAEGTREVLAHFGELGLKGGCLRLEGRIIAFTFGEQINEDTAVVHVEKADPMIRGAFPAINQAYVAHAWPDMTYINREEDLGVAGLRRAKESYKPEKMIEKFRAVRRG